MKFIKDTTWEEVFEGWRRREAANPAWIECATKAKGWPDWESWRRFTASLIGAENRRWRIIEFTDPMNEAPAMLIGPFSGWQSRVANKNRTTFEELLDIEEQREFFSRHGGVRRILEGLPFATEFIGLMRKDTEKIVCIEGHHRAVAVTLAKKQGKPVDFSGIPVSIALAELAADECPLLDEVLERGSSRGPKK